MGRENAALKKARAAILSAIEQGGIRDDPDCAGANSNLELTIHLTADGPRPDGRYRTRAEEDS
jgi:hypothetical protein